MTEKSIKLSLAIAPENALTSAFVVFRDDIEVSMRKASDFGYDGVELALLHRDQVDSKKIQRLAQQLHLEVPMVSTGQVFVEGSMWFTADDISIREKAMTQFSGLMEVAADFGADINIGRLRGFIADDQSLDQAELNFISSLEKLSDKAKLLGVRILIEPVNRYEINYINSCRDGGRLLDKLNRPNVLLMPDVFHMNIEDVNIPGELERYFDRIGYIHFADSNRYYPGNAHMDFPAIIQILKKHNYDGYIGVEILPEPDPDTAALESISYLRPLLK